MLTVHRIRVLNDIGSYKLLTPAKDRHIILVCVGGMLFARLEGKSRSEAIRHAYEYILEELMTEIEKLLDDRGGGK